MAKTTQKQPAPATKAPESIKPMAKEATQLTYVSQKALSQNVGEDVVKSWASVLKVEDDAKHALEGIAPKKGEALAKLTNAFYHAAKEDSNIKLVHITGEDKPAIRELRQRLEVAVGIKTAIRNDDGTFKIALAPWTKDVFVQPGETEDNCPTWRAKENFRSNWHTTFTKCMRAAQGAIACGLVPQIDKATGNMMVSGPAIKERFKVDSVVLNEKQTVTNPDGTSVKLPKIPSFTELGRMAMEKVGKNLQTRSQAKTINPLNEADVTTAVKSLTTTIGKLKAFGDELGTALEALQDACADAIDRNGEEPEKIAS